MTKANVCQLRQGLAEGSTASAMCMNAHRRRLFQARHLDVVLQRGLAKQLSECLQSEDASCALTLGALQTKQIPREAPSCQEVVVAGDHAGAPASRPQPPPRLYLRLAPCCRRVPGPLLSWRPRRQGPSIGAGSVPCKEDMLSSI